MGFGLAASVQQQRTAEGFEGHRVGVRLEASRLDHASAAVPALEKSHAVLPAVQPTAHAGLEPEQDLPLPVTKPIAGKDDLGMALLALVGEAERRGFDAEQALRRTLHKVFGALGSPHDKMTQTP